MGVENAKIAFDTLLGSQEKTKQMMADIDEFAAKTPFEKINLTPLVQQLMGMGFEAEKTLPIVQVLGDSMSALGRSQADLDGVVLALGQIQTKGKVSAEELMQRAERGLPVFDILEKKLGLTKKQLSDIGNAGISSATGVAALLTGLNERFGGSMAKMSQTLTGQWSNLMDNLKSLVGNTGQAVNDKVKGFIAKINDWFAANRTEIQKTMTSLFVAIGSIFETIVGVLGTFGSVFGAVMDSLVGYTQGTTTAQGSMWRQLFMYIANAVAAIGAIVSIMVRGLSLSLGTLWNALQIVGQGIISSIVDFAAAAFLPIQGVINIVIGGINLLKRATGQATIELVDYSQQMWKYSSESMKKSAAENGQDIANLVSQASEGMAGDIQKAISSMDTNWNSLNANIDTTGKNTKSLNERINKTLGDMAGSLNGVAGAHGNAAGAAKAQGAALKKLKDDAESAIKPILDKLKENYKDIEDIRKKINETKEKWKEYRQEGIKALSDVRNELVKLRKEAWDIEIKFKSQQDTKLSDRYVEVLKEQKQAQADLAKEQANTDQDPTRLLELQTQITNLGKERQLIENGISKGVLEQAVQYDQLSQTEKIIIDLQKEKNKELDDNRKKTEAAIEKQMILEAQANQKKIGDLAIHTQLKDGMMTASIELEKGKQVEIHDQENIALANDIAQKQTAFKTEFDTLTQQLASKYAAQQSHLADTQALYKSFNQYLKDDTKKTAMDMVANLQQVAENLRQVISLRAQAGMGGGGGISGARALGGPMNANEPYLVGERGPEIVIPNSNSYVVPNKSIGGGGVQINLTIGTANVRSDQDIISIARQVKDEITRDGQLFKLGIS
jgi:tape measure domain-containing protein